MKHRSGITNPQPRRIRRLLLAAALTGVVLAGAAGAAETSAAAPAQAASSCVACHTDAEKLKVEAALVPAPPASALQAGKG